MVRPPHTIGHACRITPSRHFRTCTARRPSLSYAFTRHFRAIYAPYCDRPAITCLTDGADTRAEWTQKWGARGGKTCPRNRVGLAECTPSRGEVFCGLCCGTRQVCAPWCAARRACHRMARLVPAAPSSPEDVALLFQSSRLSESPRPPGRAPS